MLTPKARFREIVKEQRAEVHRQALCILGNRRDAEEAVQDVFMHVYRGLDSFRNEAQLSTWIFRITVNVCRTMRRGYIQNFVFLEEVVETLHIARASPSPGEELVELEGHTRIEQLIAMLPAKQASAVTLCHLEERPYSEIAAILQIPKGSVASLLYRGRRKLKKLVIRYYKEETVL